CENQTFGFYPVAGIPPTSFCPKSSIKVSAIGTDGTDSLHVGCRAIAPIKAVETAATIKPKEVILRVIPVFSKFPSGFDWNAMSCRTKIVLAAVAWFIACQAGTRADEPFTTNWFDLDSATLTQRYPLVPAESSTAHPALAEPPRDVMPSQ